MDMDDVLLFVIIAVPSVFIGLVIGVLLSSWGCVEVSHVNATGFIHEYQVCRS